jgi:hypothetical protein
MPLHTSQNTPLQGIIANTISQNSVAAQPIK